MSISPLIVFALMAAATSATSDIAIDQRDAAHSKYKNCKAPKNFAKRFAKMTLEQALEKTNGSIEHLKPGPLEQDNPVVGARVTSNDVFARTWFSVPLYGYDHSFANIFRKLGGENVYTIGVSNTNYSAGSKVLILNELAEIYVKQGAEIRAIKLSDARENGFCSWTGAGKQDTCFSTASAAFEVDKALFEALANADPAKPIVITSKRHDGAMSKCPLYFSPLSFKAPMMRINGQYARAVAKRERQVEGGS